MIKPIIKDPIFLAQKSAPAALPDLPVAQDLRDTLAAHRDGCVGMAANMIGVARRIIIFDDILSNFKKLGVKAAALNGKERLRIMHSIFRMGTMQPFNFDWRWLVPTGLSPKDFIAPTAFEFKTGNCFRMGDTYGQASFLQIEAPELNDRILADFLDIESNILVTLHIHSIDQTKAIKTIKRKITDLDKSKIEEQKKAVRSGYDMDIIPTDLATYGDDAKKLLQDLQSHNERYFLMTPIIVNVAESMQLLSV